MVKNGGRVGHGKRTLGRRQSVQHLADVAETLVGTSLLRRTAAAHTGSPNRAVASIQPSISGRASSDRVAWSTRPGASTWSHSVHRSGRTWARTERRSHARSPYPDAGRPVNPSASNCSESVGRETFKLLRTKPAGREQGPCLGFQATSQRRLREEDEEPGGGAPDVRSAIRESLGKEGLVGRIEARLEGGEDASSFLGRDFRPVVRQEPRARGRSRSRNRRTSAARAAPLAVAAQASSQSSPIPHTVSAVSSGSCEASQAARVPPSWTGVVSASSVRSAKAMRSGSHSSGRRRPVRRTSSRTSGTRDGRSSNASPTYRAGGPESCGRGSGSAGAGGAPGRATCPARPASDGDGSGRGQDRLLGVGAGDEAGDGGGNGRAPSGPLGPKQGGRDERGPVGVVDLHLDRVGVRRHGCEPAIRKRRERSEPCAIPLGNQQDRVAARDREQARCDVGGHDRERGAVSIPHEEPVAPQDRHDVADEDRPGAGERVPGEARGVVLDDPSERGRERDGRDLAVGHDRRLDRDPQRCGRRIERHGRPKGLAGDCQESAGPLQRRTRGGARSVPTSRRGGTFEPSRCRRGRRSAAR